MTRNTNKTKEFSEKNSKCGSAGIGRQARLRGVCLMAYGFKSRHSHHLQATIKYADVAEWQTR